MHVPTEEKTDYVKDSFYEDPEHIIYTYDYNL